jgi:hypothetical protein
MAEYVKWRLTKLRAGVTMALFGLLAGLGLRTDQGPAATHVDQAASLSLPKGVHIPANSIGSGQVKFHSLLLSDEKVHQVASYASMVKIKKAVSDLSSQFIKMNDQLVKFEYKEDALNTFLLKDATAANAAKIEGVGLDGLVQGHGQVITGNLVPTQNAAPLLSIPGTLTISGNLLPGSQMPAFTLTNTSGGTLDVNVNGDNATHILKDGESLSDVQMADGSVKTLQILISGNGSATTLTISGFGTGGGGHSLVGQALVGAP